jgi:hypothetical protein
VGVSPDLCSTYFIRNADQNLVPRFELTSPLSDELEDCQAVHMDISHTLNAHRFGYASYLIEELVKREPGGFTLMYDVACQLELHLKVN